MALKGASRHWCMAQTGWETSEILMGCFPGVNVGFTWLLWCVRVCVCVALARGLRENTCIWVCGAYFSCSVQITPIIDINTNQHPSMTHLCFLLNPNNKLFFVSFSTLSKAGLNSLNAVGTLHLFPPQVFVKSYLNAPAGCSRAEERAQTPSVHHQRKRSRQAASTFKTPHSLYKYE